jgi:hypothetical protein
MKPQRSALLNFLQKMLRLQNDLNFENHLHVVSRGREPALTGIMIRFTHLSQDDCDVPFRWFFKTILKTK